MADPRSLLSDISAGKFKPAYYFFGSEDYRMVEAEKYIMQKFLPAEQQATNYIRIDGRRTRCADLIAELSSIPMLGEKQLFAIKDIQSYKPTELEKVMSLVTQEDPSRLVVLTTPSARTPKKNSKFFKTMTASTVAVEFKHLTPTETKSQVAARLKKAGLGIESSAQSMLLDLVAGSRGALNAEVDKLINYMEPGQTVTKDDVRQVCTGHEVLQIFQIGELVARGNPTSVLNSMSTLLSAGHSPVALVSLLLTHFVSLYLVKNGQALDSRRAWLTGRFRQQAGAYTAESLQRIVLLAAEADAELRRTGRDPRLVLEALVMQLVGEKSR